MQPCAASPRRELGGPKGGLDFRASPEQAQVAQVESVLSLLSVEHCSSSVASRVDNLVLQMRVHTAQFFCSVTVASFSAYAVRCQISSHSQLHSTEFSLLEKREGYANFFLLPEKEMKSEEEEAGI